MHSVSTTNKWTVCIHFSSTASLAKLLSRVDKSLIICRGQFFSTSKTEEWREGPASQKKLLRKKYKKLLLSSVQKIKSTQTSGSVFADRMEQVKKTNIELHLIKFVDCFLDGHGNYTSNLVSFKKIFVKQPFFEFQRQLYKSFGSANDIVITPTKNPSAIKKAITKNIVPNVRQTYATHSLKIFLPQVIVTNKLVVGSTLIILQRESEKMI